MSLKPQPSYRLLFLSMIVLVLTVRIGFIFYFTDYRNYLFSDFGGYWQRALNHFSGNTSGLEQWAIWPPLPHILLAKWFELLHFFGLTEDRWLSSVMVLNALLGTANAVLMTLLTRRLTGSPAWALAVGAFFGLGFPYLYFGAFVMSEHPAWTAFLGAIWLIAHSRPYPILAGILLALAVGLRPGYGLVALIVGLHLLWRSRHLPWPRRWRHAAGFSLAFLILTGAMIANNARLSNDRLTGLGANGGVGFYLSKCRAHKIETRHDGYVWVLVPPATVSHPEYGSLNENVPFHRQDHYFRLGLECLRQRGWAAWIDLGTPLNDLLFSPMFPAVGGIPGYPWLMDAHRPLLLILLILAPLAPALTPAGRQRDLAWLLLGTLGVLLFTHVILIAEHRYLYSLVFLIVPLAAATLHGARGQRLSTRAGVTYLLLLTVTFLALFVQPRLTAHPIPAESRIDMTLSYQVASARRDDVMAADIQWVERMRIPTVDFPQGPRFRHRDGTDFGPVELATGEFRFAFEAREPLELLWQIAADDAFEFYLDDARILNSDGLGPSEIAQTRRRIAPGHHRGLIRYRQFRGWSGLIAVYRPVGQPAGRHFAHVGEDAWGLTFRLP